MGETLARKNGRVCFVSGRPLDDSNPYPRGSHRHTEFVEGWRAAEAARAAKATLDAR